MVNRILTCCVLLLPLHLASAGVFTLQPGPEGKDTWVWDTEDFSHGNTGELRANNELGDLVFDPVLQHVLIEFDLSSLPGGQTIVAAELGLYLYASFSDDPNSVTAYRTTSAWLEDVRWSDRPTFGAAIDTTSVNGVGFQTWSVTGAVANWYSGAWANHGFYLVGEGPDFFQRFVSSDNDVATEPSFALPPKGATFRPYLRILTQDNGTPDGTIPEPGTLALLGFGGLAVVRRRRRA